jgi:sarcosine oxidase subunit beta
MFTRHNSLKSAYDVVTIGDSNIGRNTTIIGSNYLTPEGVKFYDKSVRLWPDQGEDFDLNLYYSTRGHCTLAHRDSATRTMRWRVEVSKRYVVRSEAAFVKRSIPMRRLRVSYRCAARP